MGRARLPWLKIWYEIIDDPKMKRLSNAEFGIWVKLLCIGGKSPERGKLLVASGIPYTLDAIARDCGCLTEQERTELDTALTKLIEMNCVLWNDKCLVIVHWEERQEVYPSQLPNLDPKRKRKKKDES